MKKVKQLAKKIKTYTDRVLIYFRIHDEKGLISLTNIAMLIVLYKLMMTPSVSFEDITALAVGVLGYQTKRAISKDPK